MGVEQVDCVALWVLSHLFPEAHKSHQNREAPPWGTEANHTFSSAKRSNCQHVKEMNNSTFDFLEMNPLM